MSQSAKKARVSALIKTMIGEQHDLLLVTHAIVHKWHVRFFALIN
jgi:hypothetical protein